jgi:hypothetical protein
MGVKTVLVPRMQAIRIQSAQLELVVKESKAS